MFEFIKDIVAGLIVRFPAIWSWMSKVRKIKSRMQFYKQVAKRIKKSKKIIDVTLGLPTESLQPSEEVARNEYEEAKTHRLRQTTNDPEMSYRELFSYTECDQRIDLVEKAHTRQEKYKRYYYRVLDFILNRPIPNFCVCEGEHVYIALYRPPGKEGEDPEFLYIRSKELGTILKRVFDDLWYGPVCKHNVELMFDVEEIKQHFAAKSANQQTTPSPIPID